MPAMQLLGQLQRTVRPLHDAQAFMRAHLRGGWFAQHGEDKFLLARYGTKGLYVDVGANHPFKISNTYRLYREGWRGLVVDPLYGLISKHKRLRPGDIQVHGAIGTEHGQMMPMWEFFPSVVSTSDEATAQLYQQRGYCLLGTYAVPMYRLDRLIECFFSDRVVDVLSVDVEGHEAECLMSLALDRHRPRSIVVEVVNAVGERNNALRETLHQHGYREVSLLGCNAVFETSESCP